MITVILGWLTSTANISYKAKSISRFSGNPWGYFSRLSLRNLSRELTRFLCVQGQEINRELSDVIKFAYKRIHFSILNYSSSFDRSMILLIPRTNPVCLFSIRFTLNKQYRIWMDSEWFFFVFFKRVWGGQGEKVNI